MSNPRDSFKEYVLEQLEGMPGLRFRRMFGAYGIYADDQFFGILHSGRLYFRTSEATRARYLEAGMSSFHPKEKVTLKNYYEVPVSVLENASELVEWARLAVHVAADV